ncbi:MAG: tetratricopeptide repeat protein [Verrucomicrobiota bacterium]
MLFRKYRIFRLPILSLLFCLCFSSVWAQQENLVTGQRAFQEGKWEEAKKAMKAFLATNPEAEASKAAANYIIGVSDFNLGNYAEAAVALQKTDAIAEAQKGVAVFYLGSAYKAAQKTKKAIEAFEKGLQLKFEEEAAQESFKQIKPVILISLSQSYETLAQKAESTSLSTAQSYYKKMIEQVNVLLKDFPGTGFDLDALRMLSRAKMGLKDYDGAKKALDDLRAKDKTGDLNESADYMMGQLFTAKGRAAKAEYNEPLANQHFEEARKFYRKLQKSENLSLASDASVKLASLEAESGRYDEAIEAYWNVPTQREIIQSQEKRIQAAKQEMQRTGGASAAQRKLRKEQDKLAMIKGGADVAVQSLMGVADVMVKKTKFDEARVILQHVQKFVDVELQKGIQTQIIITYSLQGQTAKADKIYAELEKKYPGDRVLETVQLLLATSLMKQEKFSEAIKALDQYLKKYPDGKMTGEAIFQLAWCYEKQNEIDKAVEAYDKFIGIGKAAPEVLDNAKLARAKILWKMNKIGQAQSAFKDLTQNASQDSMKEEAAFLYARYMLGELKKDPGKIPLVIQAFRDFLNSFPQSPNAPQALFQIASLKQQLGKQGEARAAFQELIDQYPDSPIAINSFVNIWNFHKAAKKYDEMLAVMDQFIKAHPKNIYVLAAIKEKADYELKIKKDVPKASVLYKEMYEVYLTRKQENHSEAKPGGKAYKYGGFGLLTSANILRRSIKEMGSPAIMSPEEKKEWQETIERASKLYKDGMQEFAGSNYGAGFLDGWSDLMAIRMQHNLVDVNAVIRELTQLVGATDNQDLKNQYRMVMGRMLLKTGKVQQAIDRLTEVFDTVKNPESISPEDYDDYMSLLMDKQMFGKVESIISKMMKGYSKSKAKKNKNKTDAMRLYYLAEINVQKGKNQEAEKLFEELKQKYPNSTKNMAALFSRALVAKKTNKFDEALELLKQVITSSRSDPMTRARAALERGLVLWQLKRDGIKSSVLAADVDAGEVAAKELEKLSITAEEYPQICAEALYHAILVNKHLKRDEKANKLTIELKQKYPNSHWAKKI